MRMRPIGKRRQTVYDLSDECDRDRLLRFMARRKDPEKILSNFRFYDAIWGTEAEYHAFVALVKLQQACQ